MREQVVSNKNVRNANTANRSKIRTMVQIGMLSAIAVILMAFEFPLPFAPAFYKIDLSEVPVLIGCFAMGPMAGVIIELIKVVLHMIFVGTTTAGVGDVANFIIGCAFIVPASLIYKYKRTRKGALVGMSVGTVLMTVIGGLCNAFVLLPLYAAAFGGMEAIIAAGTAINGGINGIGTFVLLAVTPFNLVKGVVVSLITLLLYKRVRVLLKAD